PYSAREGTPAAKNPPVNGNIIKDRAKRLRAAGAKQVAKHLRAQHGKTHHILMENAHMGRTAQFTEVKFDTKQAESQIVTAKITGDDGKQLLAE
ncbi:MAG: tRNA (N(6)-L-threonylcarbamoyladenosine(37)-C(2))-methylthiotransferase MtaB, partial [Pseudomonadota bacterium]